ncbi:hypothetical protein [Mycolicibacterium thermoresistibile]|nr:hypothetical protein [Mycolicibacterium thermoresistibile]MCV7188116.1 hypothetical protein [Mycolicibacterium thermoresistibile]GAT16120.1 putative uncharacterized protein [Mycolicibacterium thermoresistibile]SNW16312.1 Uncharacterised protein [Mycolicibacterium thermoresistibile]
MPDGTDADHNTPDIEYLPGGAVRMRTVSDRELAHRMAVAEYAAMPWAWVVFGIVLILMPPLIIVTEMEPEAPFFTTELLGGLVVGVLVFAFVVVGAIYRANPDYWRFGRLPVGTTVYCDVTPDWIGIGWADRYTALARSQVDRVREHRSILVIIARGQKILVPRELMPADAAKDVKSGSTRRDRFGATAVHVNTPPPRPPLATGLSSDRDQVIRTHATADRTLADRLARAARRSSAVRKVARLLMIFPVAAVVALFLDDERSLCSSMFLPLMMMGIAGYGLLGYYAFYGARAHLRRLVPEESPLSAEFGPTWVSVQLGGYFEAVGAPRITKMEPSDSAVVMTIQGPIGRLDPRLSSEGLLIPTELLPHSVEDLLNRYV